MAKPITTTPPVKGAAARRILHEIRHGTPNTAQRIETIRRADRVYQRSTESTSRNQDTTSK